MSGYIELAVNLLVSGATAVCPDD